MTLTNSYSTGSLTSTNTFTKPVFKKNYYISKVIDPLFIDCIDVKIKSISKLNNDKGYIVSLYIDNTDVKKFQDIDNDTIYTLLSNNNIWFDNNLSEDDIINLFMKSVCEQNNTIDVVINDNSKVFVNDKIDDIKNHINNINYLRKCILNINIRHIGLYIYSKQTFNRWFANNINIYEDMDENYIESKEDIDNTWKDLVEDSNKILNEKIQNIEDTKTKINMLYSDICKNNNNREWASKIQELRKIIQNIIF
jgi:hypothetical protein